MERRPGPDWTGAPLAPTTVGRVSSSEPDETPEVGVGPYAGTPLAGRYCMRAAPDWKHGYSEIGDDAP